MPLAYCPKCKLLKTIRKAPPTLPGEREAWRMAAHENGAGVRCDGEGKKV